MSKRILFNREPFLRAAWLCVRARTVGGLCASADLLAEHEGEVVLSLLMMSEVFETQSLQEAQQTLIIYRKLIPCQKQQDSQDLTKQLRRDIKAVYISQIQSLQRGEYLCQLFFHINIYINIYIYVIDRYNKSFQSLQSNFFILWLLSSFSWVSSSVFNIPSVKSLCLPITV